MREPEQPGAERWLLHGGFWLAGGIVGAMALATAVLAILTAIAANFMIWLLVIPWVVGGWQVWAVTIAVFLAMGVGSAYGVFLVVRTLFRFVRRRLKERNDGVQV